MESESLPVLVNAARNGDPSAFDVLVRRYQDRAVAYAQTLLSDRAAAEDAAQEAFVQAWRDLPRLAEPLAFPAWLRRIVFKFCDRIRRTPAAQTTFVSLDAAGNIAGNSEPARLLERATEAAQVRRALDALPLREREAALLYYLGDHDLGEIAAFLGIPQTTVKNRLHAARKRLRKDLEAMAESILAKEKPSLGKEFAGQILARLVGEFQQQMQTNPHTADRALLTEGRERLAEVLDTEQPLDWKTVRAAFTLLQRQDDRRATAALLMRYVGQTSDDSSTAWAYLHLANACACESEPVGAIYAYEEMERWLPGRRPRLSTNWPYDPLPHGAEGDAYEGEDEVRLRVLSQSGEFAAAWGAVGRRAVYLAKVDAALARIPSADRNRDGRFSALRMATVACEVARDNAGARAYIARMYRLAEEPVEEVEQARWQAKALGHDINLCHRENDTTALRKGTHKMTVLLAVYAHEPWATGERHDLAHHLSLAGYPEEALPLLETNSTHGGHVNAYGYLMHAAIVWAVTHDRAQSLSLLRDAAVRDDRDLISLFQGRAEFTVVRDDEEFLNAIRKPLG